MKIAFYIPVLNVGGAEKVIINLLKQLVLSSDDEYFLITDTLHSSWIAEIDSKIRIVNVNSHVNILKRLYTIKECIKSHQIELVVSHLTHSNIHSLILKTICDFKLIIVEHNITSDYINDIPKGRLVLKVLVRFLFKRADKIVCVSNATKTDLIGSFKISDKRCQVIYNPFDFEKILTSSKEQIPEEFIEKIANRRFIVTVARLEIQKNHLFLLTSISEYLLRNNVALVLVGDGSQRELIEAKIEELCLTNHVFLTGYQSNPYPFINAAHLLIHPARFEGFGLVLIEAIYLHTHVISMNYDTAYEILDNGRLGAIVFDEISLTKSINECFTNYSTNISASNEVYNRFKLEIIAEYYLNTFKNVLAKDG